MTSEWLCNLDHGAEDEEEREDDEEQERLTAALFLASFRDPSFVVPVCLFTLAPIQ